MRLEKVELEVTIDEEGRACHGNYVAPGACDLTRRYVGRPASPANLAGGPRRPSGSAPSRRPTRTLSPEPFRERSDQHLQALSDEQLIAYIRAAHRAGRPDAGKRGLAILVFGHWDRIRFRVARKVPPREVDDVTAAVIESALGATFHGVSVGEVHAFMNRIAARRIADYSRGRKPDPAPLPDSDDEEAPFGLDPSTDSEVGAVEARMVVEQVLDELSLDHRRVVELYCIEQRPAAETAALVEGMTEANVHQIASRFRTRLREALDDGDTSH